jgi:hypothetical protein
VRIGRAGITSDLPVNRTIIKVSGIVFTQRHDGTLSQSTCEIQVRENLVTGINIRACIQRRLLSKAASLLASPRAISSRLPSRDQWKSKIMPELNFVRCVGSPPASGCSQML